MTTFPYSDPDEYLALDPQGRFLFAANVGADEWGQGGSSTVSVFAIDPSIGTLNPVAGSPFTTGGLPLAVTTDNSGRFLYVADSNSSSGAVWGYTISTTGSLQSIAGSPFPVVTHPIWVRVDAANRFLLVSDGTDITSYSINKGTGAISATQNWVVPGGQFALMSAH